MDDGGFIGSDSEKRGEEGRVISFIVMIFRGSLLSDLVTIVAGGSLCAALC